MKISWYGHACFKIISKGATIVTDPFSKDIGLNPPRCEADIVTISHDHYDHNNTSSLRGNPFIINTPGEYNLKNVSIFGIDSFHDNKQGKERGLNTIYVIETEDMRICHLGDLGQNELYNEQLDKIGEVDILMIPVGGVYTINSDKAVGIINQIEPSIVIPMHFSLPKLKIKLHSVDEFLKEMGIKEKKPIEHLVIKKNDLSKEETKVILMSVI